METSSAFSESYIAVEQRIRGSELSLSELEHLLDGLVRQEQISSAEQQALLELAWSINTNAMPPLKDV
jgi:hypothetical protein